MSECTVLFSDLIALKRIEYVKENPTTILLMYNHLSYNLPEQGRTQEFLIGGVQTLVQKGLLNFCKGKFFLTETTTCFSNYERRSPLAREQIIGMYPKTIPFLNIPGI